MGLGLFRLATNVGNSFELQGFQCRFGGSRAAVFAGFALKVAGSTLSIVGKNVSVDGSLYTGTAHPMGLKVVGSPVRTISLDSHDNCVHFHTNKHQHSFSPGYYHNMNINVADSVVAFEGVCGSSSGRQPVQRNDSLFSDSELDSLCSMCGMSNCVRRLGGRRLEMSAPDDWIPANNAKEACTMAGISYDVAAEKCQKLQDDVAFFEACIYDFCASDGDEALVENAVDSKQREIARSKVFKSSAAIATTTVGSHVGHALSLAPTTTRLSVLAILVTCFVANFAW